jgi:restriction system protein
MTFQMEPLLPLIGLAVVATIGAVLITRIRERRRPSAVELIDRMDGPAFEQYLVGLFKRLGFTVKHVGARNDYGADLIVERNGSRVAVQAKARRDYVAISAVQQALGARFYYSCDGALVVTNRFFSKPAKTLARRADVALWDRHELVAAIAQADSDEAGSQRAA